MSPTMMIPGQWEPRPSRVVVAAPAAGGLPTLVAVPFVRVPEALQTTVETAPRSWLGVSILVLLVVAMLLAMWASSNSPVPTVGAIPVDAAPRPIRAVVVSS